MVAQIGGDLTIESLQDTATFHSRQKSSGGSLTLGPVPGASLSFDKSQIDSDFASVGTQSGIKAGDGGFDVAVNGKTDLIGGVISSTQVAVDAGNNRWVTGSLSTQDIENQATYQADAYGVTLGVGSLRSTSDAGIGQDDGQSRSSSRAGISNVAGDTGVRSDDASTGLAPIFDKTRVQDELDAQVTITRTFSREGSVAWGHYANDRFTEAAARGDEEATACWGPDGACRAGGHVLIGGAAGGWGGATGAGLTSVTAPHVAGFLIQQGVAPETATMLTQLLALGGGVAVGGASGGAGGLNEVSHNAGALITFVTKLAEQGQRLGPAGLRQLSQANQAVLRACATSTVCKNLLPPTAAVWLSGQITLENQAHQPSLADLIPGNGFGAGGQPKPVGPLVNPIPDPQAMQRLYGPPPLQNDVALRTWLGNALEGYSGEEAARWAQDFVRTLPASQQDLADFILLSVQDNQVAGNRREREVHADLVQQYPGSSVQDQQYLRDRNGNIAIELKFAPPRQPGQLPSLIHALQKH